MKKYMVMPAFTGSEWDQIDFSLLEIFPERLEYFKEMRDLIHKLNEEHGVNEIVVYADNVDFFIDRTELPIEIDEEYMEFTPFVTELVDFNGFTRPEQDIRYGSMKFRLDEISFTASGKHTGEEFWCSCDYETLFK